MLTKTSDDLSIPKLKGLGTHSHLHVGETDATLSGVSTWLKGFDLEQTPATHQHLFTLS
jgi:hypothetical protein